LISHKPYLIKDRLEHDEQLANIEKELEDSVLIKKSSEVDEEVKKEITKLLSKSGYDVKIIGEGGGATEGDGDGTGRPPTPRPTPTPVDPIPTLEYPDVTYLKIIFPKDELKVPLGESRIIKIETDANFKFDREKRIAIRIDGKDLEFASKTHLKDGRMNWRVRTTEEAKEEEIGEIVISLTKPSGEQLKDSILYEIEPARIRDTKGKGKVPPFEIVPIDPNDPEDVTLFETIWPDIDKGAKDKVAYKAVEFQGEIKVYYSKAFLPYRLVFAPIDRLSIRR